MTTMITTTLAVITIITIYIRNGWGSGCCSPWLGLSKENRNLTDELISQSLPIIWIGLWVTDWVGVIDVTILVEWTTSVE